VKTRFYEEMCCEDCHEVVHTHFDCPNCEEKRAPTDFYDAIGIGETFRCDLCKVAFRRTGEDTIETFI